MSIYGELSAEGGRDGEKVVIIVTASRNLRSENCQTVHANQWSCINQEGSSYPGSLAWRLEEQQVVTGRLGADNIHSRSMNPSEAGSPANSQLCFEISYTI